MKHIFTLTLTLLLVALKGFSQAPVQQAKNFELDIPMSWNASYEAKELITLKKGFSFTSNNKSKFSAKINASIDSPVDGGNGNITQGLTTGYTGPGGPSDAPPGALPLVVDVSATGASTASMAFSFPQGFGGIAPQLGMSYSSQSSDGAFGMAWNLTGISMITRTAQNYYYDNNVNSLTYTNSDRLMIDGNRMMLETGTYGNTGSTYSLERDNFSTITASNTNALGAPESFTVIGKDGTQILYGGSGYTAKSILTSQSGQLTGAWLINRVTDLKGNYVQYYYSSTGGGQFKVTSIEYSGNTSIGLAPKNSIEFLYAEFDETETYYSGGQTTNYNYYIKEIVIKEKSTNTELTKYVFTYTGKKLTEINLYSKGLKVCKPTKINWNSTQELDTFLQFDEFADLPGDYEYIEDYINYTGDFTGEGLMDVFKINQKLNYDWKINDWKLLKDNNGVLEEVNTGTLPSRNKYRPYEEVWVDYEIYFDWSTFKYKVHNFYETKAITAGNFPYTVFDIDRDGILELCVIEGNKDEGADNCDFVVYKISGNTLTEQTRKTNIGLFAVTDVLYIGDFTGTGQIEIFKLQAGKTSMTSIQNSFTTSNKFDMSAVPLNKTFSLFEFNGNAKTEFMAVDGNNIRIYEANNKGSYYKFETLVSLINVYPKEIESGDYNSDGLADLLIYNGNLNKWQLYCSNGKDGFILKEDSFVAELNNTNYPNYSNEYTLPEKTYFSIDPEQKYFRNWEAVWDYYAAKSGGHYTQAELDQMFKTANCNNYISTDINADGKTDIIRVERYVWVENYNSGNFSFDKFCTKYVVKLFLASTSGFIKKEFEGPVFKAPYGGGLPECTRIAGNKIGCIEYRFSEFDRFNTMFVADYNNDGYPELIFNTDQSINIVNNPEIQNSIGSVMQFYGGEDESYIASITNGMNTVNEFNYVKLNKSTVYTQNPTTGLPANVNEFCVPLNVVSSKIVKTNGSTEVSHTNYSYSTLRFHTQKGFLGVKSFTADEIISGVKSISEYSLDNTFILPYVSVDKQYINGNLLSQSNYEYLSVSKGGKKYFQYLNSTSTKNAQTGHIITTSYNMNTTNGNINSETKTYGTDGSIVINYIGYNTKGQPAKVSVTRNQDGAFTTSTDYTYDSYGNVKTVTNSDGVTTTYTYCADNTNIDYFTENAYNTTTRFTYDGSKLLVTKKELEFSNGVKHIQTSSFDADGRLIRSVDENGLASLYLYDIYGNVAVKLSPNGKRVASSYGWTSGTNNITWFKKITDDSGNISTAYFDNLGRQIKQVSTPAGGKYISLETFFNADGTVNREVSNADGTTSYTYKSDGRLNSVTSMGKTISYSYSGGTTSTTVNGVSSSQRVNAFGQVVNAHDAGGDISYTYHESGNVETTTTNGHTITMAYDAKGRQTTLNDPDAGAITYTYDGLGRPYTMSDVKGNTTVNSYDAVYGRLLTQTTTPATGVGGAVRVLTYQYDPDNQHYGFIKQINNSESGINTVYGYDRLGRTTSVSENILGNTYSFNYEYDSDGKVIRIIYPDGFSVTNTYNGNYLSKIIDDKAGIELFNTYVYNLRGQVESYKQGNNSTVNNSFDSYGNIDFSEFGPTSNRVKYDYSFDAATGMISGRSKITAGVTQSETFTYDDLYRLTNWNVTQAGATKAYTINYSNNGNIVQKSDIGYYAYDATKTHAVTSVSQLSGSAFSTTQNNITYNAFNKVVTANLATGTTIYDTYSITYGSDDQRRIANKNGALTIYFGLYEVRSNGDKLHYIQTPDGLCGLIVTNGATQTNYYLHNDHLGSLVAAEAQDGTLTEFSYDPWGRRRNPTNWNDYDVTESTLFTRGFTGHEHINNYGLINMNGRIYDARLGRFLSPDPYIQAPGFTQNYNRYSYCLNNPLNLTDPSGYRFIDKNGVHYRSWFDKWGPKIVIGTVSLVATVATAGSMSSLTVGLAGAELASMTVSIAVVSAMAGGAVAGFANSWTQGATLGESLGGAFMGGIMAGLTAAVTAGILQGIGSLPAGKLMNTVKNGGRIVRDPTVAMRLEQFMLTSKMGGLPSLFNGVNNASLAHAAGSTFASNVVANSVLSGSYFRGMPPPLNASNGGNLKGFAGRSGYEFEAIHIDNYGIAHVYKLNYNAIFFDPAKQVPNGDVKKQWIETISGKDFNYLEIYRPFAFERNGNKMFQSDLGNNMYELNSDFQLDQDRLYFRWRNDWSPDKTWQYFSIPRLHPTIPSGEATWF